MFPNLRLAVAPLHIRDRLEDIGVPSGDRTVRISHKGLQFGVSPDGVHGWQRVGITERAFRSPLPAL